MPRVNALEECGRALREERRCLGLPRLEPRRGGNDVYGDRSRDRRYGPRSAGRQAGQDVAELALGAAVIAVARARVHHQSRFVHVRDRVHECCLPARKQRDDQEKAHYHAATIPKSRFMDTLSAFGLLAVTLMVVCYALEKRSPWYILGFAAACVLGSIYGFLQGAWPFGVVEALWAAIAVWRWRGEVRE